MATIQWRPEVNALTTPQSYRARVVPRNVVGYDELAAEIATELNAISADVVRLVLVARNRVIARHLSNGNQVTEENAFTYSTSLSVRLDSPEDPLPADEDILQVNVRVSRPFVKEVRQLTQLERLPMSEKLPLITSAEDTKLKLADVLNPKGLLRLTGSNLFFDEDSPDCGCIITGTQSGETKQSTFGTISNSEILLMPELPAQAHAWNNEYTVTLTTQYTERGTPRTGIYRRRLRSPLTATKLGHPNPPETGILSGNGASPLVSIKGGTVTADERLRVQAVLDVQTDRLLLNLLDMKEGGAAGAEVVAANGNVTLQGFSGSAVSSLAITVNDYASLKKLVRNDYSGRLVDILDVKTA